MISIFRWIYSFKWQQKRTNNYKNRALYTILPLQPLRYQVLSCSVSSRTFIHIFRSTSTSNSIQSYNDYIFAASSVVSIVNPLLKDIAPNSNSFNGIQQILIYALSCILTNKKTRCLIKCKQDSNLFRSMNIFPPEEPLSQVVVIEEHTIQPTDKLDLIYCLPPLSSTQMQSSRYCLYYSYFNDD